MASVTDYRDELYLRIPGKGRKSFAIVKRRRRPNGKHGPTKTLKSTVIDGINRQYQTSILTLDEATKAARTELDRLKQRHQIRTRETVMSAANRRTLDLYWKAVYAHKSNKAMVSARARLDRAVGVLGEVSLSASQDELQQAINTELGDKPTKQRAVVSALNQILKWLGRTDVVLSKARKPVIQVKYVTLAEFEQLAGYIQDEMHRTLAWVAFSTGCRLGEAFSMTERTYNRASKTVFIQEQRLEDWEPAPPKNNRVRHAPVLREGLPWLEKWWAVSEEQRQEIRTEKYAEIVRGARDRLRESGGPKLDITRFHDLRHSYAIHLLNLGVPTSLVAQALGDSVSVVESHYIGFILTTPGLDAINRILDRG